MVMQSRHRHEAVSTRSMRALAVPSVWLSFLLVGCGASSGDIAISDLAGQQHTPLAVPAGTVHVVVFTSQECPIANAYAPTLGRLADAWSERAVRVFLVHTDPELSVDAARQHRDDYELPGTILRDPGHDLAKALGATRTPEAVVLGQDGIAYRGRIDNQWAKLGARAPAATQHDLRDAVEVALGGDKVRLPHPAAVGCLLPEPAR